MNTTLINKPLASCAAGFFSLGLFVSLIAIEIPRIKAELDLSELGVAGATFSLAAAAVIGMWLLPKLVHRFGSGRVQRWTWLGMCLCMPWMFAANNWWSLYLCAALVGLFSGSLDVAMNAQSLEVERAQKRPVLSALHGVFSLAGLIGGVIGYQLIAGEWGRFAHAVFFAAPCLGLWAWLSGHYIADNQRNTDTDAAPAGSRKLVILLCAVMMASLANEGSVENWAGIYLNAERGWSFADASLGYISFALAMVIGRFGGDSLRQYFALKPLLIASCSLTFAGYIFALYGPPAWLLGGYFALGLGLSLQVPLVFALIDASPQLDTVTVIAQASAVGYSGLLLGPVVVGALAAQWGLLLALSLIACLPIVQWLLLRHLLRAQR